MSRNRNDAGVPRTPRHMHAPDTEGAGGDTIEQRLATITAQRDRLLQMFNEVYKGEHPHRVAHGRVNTGALQEMRKTPLSPDAEQAKKRIKELVQSVYPAPEPGDGEDIEAYKTPAVFTDKQVKELLENLNIISGERPLMAGSMTEFVRARMNYAEEWQYRMAFRRMAYDAIHKAAPAAVLAERSAVREALLKPTADERAAKELDRMRFGVTDAGKRIATVLRFMDVDEKTLTPEERDIWNAYTQDEKQYARFYIAKRRRKEFVRKQEDDPRFRILPEDSDTVRAQKTADFKAEQIFQAEQKELADAFEIIALPMLRAVLQKRLAPQGLQARVYLTGVNDDYAGGLDVAVDILNADGSPKLGPDGKPMRLALDATYAMYRQALQSNVDEKKRFVKDIVPILKEDDEEVPEPLRNAVAMKLMRTLAEAKVQGMSTLSVNADGVFNARGQDHVPRLIMGLTWKNTFSEMATWANILTRHVNAIPADAADPAQAYENALVTAEEEYENTFANSLLANRLSHMFDEQLRGLDAFLGDENGDTSVSGDPHNNRPHIHALIDVLGAPPDGAMQQDQSLQTVAGLLGQPMGEDGLKGWQKGKMKREWQGRFWDAARVQATYWAEHGVPQRKDGVGPRREAPETNSVRTKLYQTINAILDITNADEVYPTPEAITDGLTGIVDAAVAKAAARGKSVDPLHVRTALANALASM